MMREATISTGSQEQALSRFGVIEPMRNQRWKTREKLFCDREFTIPALEAFRDTLLDPCISRQPIYPHFVHLEEAVTLLPMNGMHVEKVERIYLTIAQITSWNDPVSKPGGKVMISSRYTIILENMAEYLRAS